MKIREINKMTTTTEKVVVVASEAAEAVAVVLDHKLKAVDAEVDNNKEMNITKMMMMKVIAILSQFTNKLLKEVIRRRI